MSAPLLVTKLYIPPVRPETVSRPRLMDRLDAGLQCKLTLVSAPAGSGKTTLLSTWIHDRGSGTSPLRAAWLSLDEGDSDLARFLTYLVAALQTFDPDFGEDALSAFRTPQPPPIEAVLTSLLNEMAHLLAPSILVLDDYHLIEGQPVHDALAFLVDHLPPQMHLVIATRSDPPLSLARLRGRGHLNELRVADLRFTSGEVAGFLRQTVDLDLSPEEIAALEARTEGWIAGLQLAALSLEMRRQMLAGFDVSGFVKEFAGDDRYIVDYLLGEVLEGQTDSIQTFLLQTSILSRLSAPLCDVVTGRTDSQRTLELLERSNLFIVPLDQKRVWYRYHQLFADLLRQRLQLVGSEWIPGLHIRASQWYERHGFAAEAIGHALVAQEFERAAQLIWRSSWLISTRGETATLLGWLDALPDEWVRTQPRLCVIYAWASLSAMQLDAIEPHLQDAERAMALPSRLEEAVVADGLPGQSDGRQIGIEGLQGEIAAMRAVVASIRGEVPRTIELSHKALSHLPEGEVFLRGMVTNSLGTAYEYSGHTEAAGQAFTEAAALCRRVGDNTVALIALSNLGRQKEIQGQLHQAEATYRQMLQWSTERRDRPQPVAGLAYVGLAGLFLEWNKLDEAAYLLQEGIRLGQQMANVEIQTNGAMILARVYQAQGDTDGAMEAIEQAEELVQRYHVSVGSSTRLPPCRARLWIAAGRLEAAAAWLRESGLGVEDEVSYQREPGQIILARLLIAQSEPARAVGLLERLLGVAEEQGRMGTAIELLVLLALAWQGQGDTTRALAALGQALILAEPEGYVRVFLDEGQPMAALLRQAALHCAVPKYVGNLLAAFGHLEQEAIRKGLPSKALPPHGDQGLVEPLSERELEVLRRIAGGLSNREIAEELVITVGTVKWHANNIYGKLGVRSRTQAVARAQELHLL